MAVRVYNQSRSSTPAAISIPDGSLATKLKTSQQVSVICCESWVLWRKHLKRSAGDGCLLFLLKSISRLTLPLLPWWMRVRVCVCVTKQHKHTPTHRQMETHAAREKKKKSVSHPCRACAHRAASVRGAGGCWGVEGGGGLTNVPLLTFKLLWAGDWSILRTSTKNSSTARDRNTRERTNINQGRATDSTNERCPSPESGRCHAGYFKTKQLQHSFL